MIGGSGTYPTASALGMETSSHGHGGSITEDFVSHFPGLLRSDSSVLQLAARSLEYEADHWYLS